MATGFLDKNGVSTLWSKIKGLVSSEISAVKDDIQTAANDLNAILGDPTNDPSGDPVEGGE